MATQTSQPTGAQAAIVKGKSPRNALIGVGFVAALLIGGIGIYYQFQAGNKAQEEARQQKSDKAAQGIDQNANDRRCGQDHRRPAGQRQTCGGRKRGFGVSGGCGTRPHQAWSDDGRVPAGPVRR